MIDVLHDWVLSLTAASLITAVALQLLPKGNVRTVTGFLCGVVLLGVLLRPFMEPDTELFSDSIGRYRSSLSEFTETAEEREKELLRTYIEEKYAAYILDEAHVLGVETADIRITVKWGDGSWVPEEAFLDMEAEADIKARISTTLFTELGIPAERQHWNDSG